MTDDRDLDAALDEIHSRAVEVQAALAQVRGTGTAANGTIIATSDAAGRLRDLKLPTDVARLGAELAGLIIQATTAAQQDAQTQATRALLPLTGDERVQAGLNAIREDFDTLTRAQAPKPMTTEETQAATEAAFQQRNRTGWNYSL
ncbi:YbaB/EbfC family nucleoid-associated protein [Nocardia sp. NPDC088792]|uniref:YbaB/EbfC family nucleoid-associated protein n=1 Tax=Nocardia sp. NPDC088792 TaxID=3364332 RepID=UPI003804BDDC